MGRKEEFRQLREDLERSGQQGVAEVDARAIKAEKDWAMLSERARKLSEQLVAPILEDANEGFLDGRGIVKKMDIKRPKTVVPLDPTRNTDRCHSVTLTWDVVEARNHTEDSIINQIVVNIVSSTLIDSISVSGVGPTGSGRTFGVNYR